MHQIQSRGHCMQVLVTGGAGFIGSSIVRRLISLGIKPIVLDNFATGKRDNIDNLLDDIIFIEGDIRDKALTEKIMDGIDTVIHQAAVPSVPLSVMDPFGSTDVNLNGTLTVLDAARLCGVKRVVFASSSSVYGNADVESISELQPTSPVSPYAAAKLSSEHLMEAYHATYGLETVALRYFNVYGPRQDETGYYSAVIPKFISAMLKGEQPTVFGDGLQSRDFVYIEDVVQANLRATGIHYGDTPQEAFGAHVNIATQSSYSLLELIDIINSELGTSIEPKFEESRLGDVRNSKAVIDRARELLRFEPEVSFSDGIKKTIVWFKDKQ